MTTAQRPRCLTGDTPTGQLHLGHWVGSLENRVAMQADYECFFVVANTHAFSTKVEQPGAIRQSVLDITLDYLAAGIDPSQSCVFIESDIPAIFELTALFGMLIPYPRLMRNPTIKDEIRDKQLGDKYSMGFLLYPIMQVADILAFQADIVPVGEDQVPHLELTREVARRFNQTYCNVDSHAEDAKHIELGGIFPIPEPKIGRVNRLVGLGGPSEQGSLLKMSKSLNNSILLCDDNDTIKKKIMGMYTDPKRLRADDPGTVENNPLWIFHDTFNSDKDWVAEAKDRYQKGTIGDVECKKNLIEAIVALLEPMQQRRAVYQQDPAEVLKILQQGAEKANAIAEKTLHQVKQTIQQLYS
jgi:tryptophanyl-tRNA synthetase